MKTYRMGISFDFDVSNELDDGKLEADLEAAIEKVCKSYGLEPDVNYVEADLLDETEDD